jgi:hypothetical protein
MLRARICKKEVLVFQTNNYNRHGNISWGGFLLAQKSLKLSVTEHHH